MNVLRFTKDGDCKTNYEVELDFEYTPSFEKKITSLILYRPDIHKSVSIPWNIFEEYIRGLKNGAFIDPTGLKVKYANNQLHITSRHFRLSIPHTHITAIRKAANEIVESVSYSVDNILREYTLQST